MKIRVRMKNLCFGKIEMNAIARAVRKEKKWV
jgi:hypothetical protein